MIEKLNDFPAEKSTVTWELCDESRASMRARPNDCQNTEGLSDFTTAVFKVAERVGGKRPTGAWEALDLVSFSCSEDVFLTALRAELGGADTVKQAGWPNTTMWAAFTRGSVPIVFEFTRTSVGGATAKGIRLQQ
jgi:hypothetical protein